MALDPDLFRQALEARDGLVDLQHQADVARADYHHAIRRLHVAGGSMREIADTLGLSHQRVHQIVGDIAASGRSSSANPNPPESDKTPSTEASSSGASAADMSSSDADSNSGVSPRGVGRTSRRARKRVASPPELATFDRLFADSRQAMAFAQEEAVGLQHDYIGTEHILLGLLRVEPGLAAKLLRSYGVELDAVRLDALRIIGRGSSPTPDGALPMTPRSKKVLDLAIREAKRDQSMYARTEHLLVALLREGKGVAAQILAGTGFGRLEDVSARLQQARMSCAFCGRSGLDAAALIAGPDLFICDQCTTDTDEPLVSGACSFCGQLTSDAKPSALTTGGDAHICGNCLTLCREILASGSPIA